MKQISIYNLPEDNNEFKLHCNAQSYFTCLFDFQDYIRNAIKFAELSKKELEIYERIRDNFYNILENNKVNLDDIE